MNALGIGYSKYWLYYEDVERLPLTFTPWHIENKLSFGENINGRMIVPTLLNPSHFDLQVESLFKMIVIKPLLGLNPITKFWQNLKLS
jgi:hypothetical protein